MSNTALASAPSTGWRGAVNASEALTLRRALARSVAAAGERLLKGEKTTGEFPSLDGSHLSSRLDLEATALTIRYVPEFFSREGLTFAVSFENEELPMEPRAHDGQRLLRLIIDPVDGTKSVDNYMCVNDVPLPPPPSAISIAAVCPLNHQLVASAVHYFDLGEVYSSCLLNPGSAQPEFMAFRGDALLSQIGPMPNITAKRRVLNGNYNSKELVKLAQLELALMDSGLNPTFGGLTGSSATDIINVVRGSFAACVDARALCAGKGSVPYWYDIAGAVGVARGRGLGVLVMTADGRPLEGDDHPIYTPVSFIVARADILDAVVGVVRDCFALNAIAAA